jgi:hypothetical protein
MSYDRKTLKRTLPSDRGQVNPKDADKVQRAEADGWELYSIAGATYAFRRRADYQPPQADTDNATA